MNRNQPHEGLIALFPPDADLDSVRLSLKEAGISQDQIALLTPVPLKTTSRSDDDNQPLWPYVIAIAAGLVGIAVGVFFAAGTALLYPLMTGGKPIVAAPIVGIISYETMMLLAIVVTLVTMIVRIKRAQCGAVDREARIDDGKIALSVSLADASQEQRVKTLLETAGAEDVRLVTQPSPIQQGVQRAHARAAWLLLSISLWSCSPDMQEQPSYRSQEAPRLHSPPGSIPRDSRAVLSREALASGPEVGRATELYRVNCLPCHGESGEGTGLVAPYLNELPANLRAPRVRSLSKTDLYQIITNGKDMMPSFQGELSASERMILAIFIQAMKPDIGTAHEERRPHD
ncbi:MAG: DUF3341 domain-containing protein [Nitrospira sp.]|nr:DUF3341 domain-containing protein [Nitrospira sp.]